MLTVGRHYNGPRLNYNTECDYCGALYPVNRLRELPNGLLACERDRDGKTEVELDWERAGMVKASSFIIREDD